jgi:hypothetical protein
MMLVWHTLERSSRRVIAFAGSSAAVSRSNQCVALQILVQIAVRDIGQLTYIWHSKPRQPLLDIVSPSSVVPFW